MKFGASARLYAGMFNWMLGGYYKKFLPERDWPAIRRRLNAEYRAMLERTPGLGKGNSLESNLVMAAYFFSMPLADPQMTPGLMDEIMEYGLASDLMKRLHAGKRKRGELFDDAHQDRRVAEAAASQTSPYEMDWRFTYVKGEDEFWCTYTACGICKLAQREGMQAYLPCLCRTDFLSYELVGAHLERTKTLGAGDDCCDFHVTRIA